MSEAPSAKASARPLYRLMLRPEPGVPDPDRALRQLLKLMLRRFKLKCISIEQVHH